MVHLWPHSSSMAALDCTSAFVFLRIQEKVSIQLALRSEDALCLLQFSHETGSCRGRGGRSEGVLCIPCSRCCSHQKDGVWPLRVQNRMSIGNTEHPSLKSPNGASCARRNNCRALPSCLEPLSCTLHTSRRVFIPVYSALGFHHTRPTALFCKSMALECRSLQD